MTVPFGGESSGPLPGASYAPFGPYGPGQTPISGSAAGGGGSIGGFFGWFNDIISQFSASTINNRGPGGGLLSTEAPLPSWVPDTLPSGQPLEGKMRDFAIAGAWSATGDDARVFMGKYGWTDDPGTIQAGTDISRATLKGLQATDFPVAGSNPQRAHTGKVRTPETITAGEAKELPYSWSQKHQRKWLDRLRDQTGVGDLGFDDAVDLWGSLIDRASKMFVGSKGKNLITPWDALDLYKDEGAFKGEGGTGPGASSATPAFTGTKVTKHEDVNKISEGDAWSTMHSAVSSLLGRDPSEQEVRDFTYRMNHLAAEDPSITKTATTYKEGVATKSKSTVVEPGMTANDVASAAYEQSQNDPDYGAYQAASTYMNLLLQSLGPTV